MHENRETSETPVVATEPQDGGRRLRPHGPRVGLRGVTLRRSTYEPFEQRQAVVGGELGREGCGSRRTLSYSTRTRLRAGLRVSHGWASVRTSDRFGRYSSARRTGCANERPSGSVRGVPREGYPYRFPNARRRGPRVRRVQSVDVDPQQRLHIHRPAADAMLQGLPLELLHGDERTAVVLIDLVNRTNVGMIQCGRRLRFPLEAGQSLRLFGYVIKKELQRHKGLQLRVSTL